MNMKIDDWEYHARMLFDIAYRRNKPLLLLMMTDKSTGETLRSVNGKADDVVFLIGAALAEMERNNAELTLDDLLNGAKTAAKLARQVLRKRVEDDDQP